MQPAGRIDPPDWMGAPQTREVLAALAAGGRPVRFVGGCVRDAVLGRRSKDIDIATPEEPATVLARLAAHTVRAIPTGLAHGTVTAVVGGRHFEITTLRRDVETDGRHARVAFTDDWVADASRRDFTMNAMFADPDGTLYDPTGGLPDLRRGVVRFVGDPVRRIAEDSLRLLRYFRFHAHYGSGPADPAALAACRAAAAALQRLSGERLAAELLRLLPAARAPEVVRLMAGQGVLAHLLPNAGGFDRLERLAAIEATLGEADALRRLAAILPAGAAPAAAALAERLRFSSAERERLAAMVAPAVELAPVAAPPRIRRALYRLGRQPLRDAVLLAWAGSAAPPDDAGWRALLRSVEEMPVPQFPLRGADVLALGLPPGPAVGALLARVEHWWEEQGYPEGRDAALAKLREMAEL